MAVPRFDSVLHKPAAADEACGKAYLSLVTFKQSLDEMEEVPRELLKIYDQTLSAMNAAAEAREEAYQLKMMLNRYLARYGR